MTQISSEAHTILLLCSHLGIQEKNIQPLTLREWRTVSRELENQEITSDILLSAIQSEALQNLSTELKSKIEALVLRDIHGELNKLASLGIDVITEVDPNYPSKYRSRLGERLPPVLFYAGDHNLIGQPGVAVVGSRNLDETSEECAGVVGNACGMSGLVLYSGGARGVDSISMQSALEARGTGVAILANNLERALRQNKKAVSRGDLCLLSPYHPQAGFSVGAAMGRNRLIYALADYAIVVASDANKGGTWAGSTEALKHKWVPVFVLSYSDMPEGNKKLLQKGAREFPYPFPVEPHRFKEWLNSHADTPPSQAIQQKLL